MKRILSSLLMLTMLLSLMPFALPAMASENSTEVYYFNDFNTDSDFSKVKLRAAYANVTSERVVTEDGTSAHRVNGTNGGSYFVWYHPAITVTEAANTQKPDIVLEFRLRKQGAEAYGYLSSDSSVNSAYSAPFTITMGGSYELGLADAIRWDRSDNTAIKINEEEYATDYDFTQWHTYSIVYKGSKPTRELYVDGKYIGETSTDEHNDTYDNSYYSTGKIALMHAATTAVSNADVKMTIETDYVKIYEKPETFTASLVNASNGGIVLNFSGVPANISADNFTLSDGTKVSYIEKISQTSYKLILENELAAGSYTLTVTDIKDNTFALPLVNTNFEITVAEKQAQSDEPLPYYNSFDTEDAISGKEFSEKTAISDYSGVTVENGSLKLYSVLNTSTTTGTSSKIYFTPGYSNEDATRQPLVLEYKVNFDANNGNHYFYQVTSDSRPYAAGVMIYPYKTTEKITSGTRYPTYHYMQNKDEWHTLSLVYDNDSNAVDFYWDGELKITNTAADTYTYTNPWDNTGKLGTVYFMNSMGSKAGGITTYIDDLKVFEKPEYFSAQVDNSEATELDKITLDFNATPANASIANIRVNGKIPASVTCVSEEYQKYEVVLKEALQPETEYKVSLNGILNTIGQETYDVISFTTRALEAGEAYYTIGNGGIVTAGEEVITDGTFAEAVSIIVVKANKGYKAVVKVNGTEIAENNKYGEYTIDTANGAEIEVLFEAAETPLFSTPLSFVSEEEPDASYTFVRLNMILPETDFGVIVSSDSDKLDAEDVDGVNTFMLPATNGSNTFGEYGIKIVDKAEGNVFGNTYYVRPYAVLDGTYYYQNPVTVNVNTVQ